VNKCGVVRIPDSDDPFAFDGAVRDNFWYAWFATTSVTRKIRVCTNSGAAIVQEFLEFDQLLITLAIIMPFL